MTLKGSGSINGKARIQRILHDGGLYDDETIEGTFSFAWGGDWYSDTAEIRYIPDNVTEGTVKFNYRFNTP